MKRETWTVFSILFRSTRTNAAGDTARVIPEAHRAAHSAESGGGPQQEGLPTERDSVIFKL